MKLEIGTKITWVSAAGRLNGTITNIKLSPSASGAITPWITVNYGPCSGVQLCALDSNLKMLKVEIYNEDMVERVNLMTGKTYMEHRDTPRFCSPSSEAYWSM
ncbi:hypothetical protein UFOVP328_423 [uncultured Caudovirales phage]|uniref:Uncharacterized protein n=1 Tax=uncultured Caudovirales phage TaxID=2100421 RepID=A0A6J5LZQ5_9CAUD|nr:hypothetical protein UFOVP328_423 [uncultured Caudovirales phage]